MGKMLRETNKIKILHIIDTFKIGGTQELILKLAKGIDKSKFSIDLVCLQGWGKFGDEVREHVANVFTLSKSKYNFSIPFSLLKTITQGHYDILHLQLEASTILGSILGRLKQVPKIVTTVSCHRAQISSIRYYAVFKLPSCFIDKYIVWSNTIHEELKRTGIQDSKITYISQGVDCSARTRPGENNSSIRSELKLDSSIPLILSVARLNKQRRLDVFINAMKMVVDKVPKAKLLLVGSGPEEDMLRELVRELNLTDNIIFLGERRDLSNLYPGCDVYATLSIDEEVGVAAKIAMTYGKPIVAVNDGHMDKKRIFEKTGFLIAVKNEEDIAESLVELLKSPEKRTALGLKAKRFAQENLSVESFVRKHEELYAELL